MTRHRMALQGTTAVVVACAVLGSLTASASAETANSSTQFSVTAGTLAFVTAPTLPELTAVTLNGEAQTTHSTVAMANFKVKDGRRHGQRLARLDRQPRDVRNGRQRGLQAVL